MTQKIYHGACICGQVEYQFEHFDDALIKSCHCKECRILTGHYMSNLRVPHDKFTWLNQQGLKHYNSSETLQRGFCENCGSQMVAEKPDADFIIIMAGALDDTTGIPFGFHYFCTEKGSYYQIPKDEIQHDGWWFDTKKQDEGAKS